MDFRLIYRGKLPSASRSDSRVREKHAIRCELHSQLKVLWREHQALHTWETQPIAVDSEQTVFRTTADLRSNRYQRCNRRFLPLVDNAHGLACSLDILFMRRDVAGSPIIKGGDIDNRLKVLLDALRVPEDCSQIPSDWEPAADQDPLYCLMEDDSLITDIRVTTDRLLLPLEDDDNYKNVFLVIHAKTLITDHERAYIEFI